MNKNLYKLTERELETLKLFHLSSKEIARKLFITTNTVTAHIVSIYEKIGTNNRTEAILIALKKGIVVLDDFDLGG